MKKRLVLLGMPLLLMACKANYPVAQESGKEDLAYLLFVSQKTYARQPLEVTIDGAAPFTAKAVKAKVSDRKGTQYGVATGTHQLKVTAAGKTLYDKKVFLSTQEVKQIILPE